MFNTFKKVLENKPITEQDAEKVSDFLMRRWLTGDNRLIELASTLNCLPGKQSNLHILRGLATALNGKIKFIRFPQGSKQDPEQHEDVELVARFFRVSKDEAHEYIQWLKEHNQQELDEIKQIGKHLIK